MTFAVVIARVQLLRHQDSMMNIERSAAVCDRRVSRANQDQMSIVFDYAVESFHVINLSLTFVKRSDGNDRTKQKNKKQNSMRIVK
jgi:hypothetical protein